MIPCPSTAEVVNLYGKWNCGEYDEQFQNYNLKKLWYFYAHAEKSHFHNLIDPCPCTAAVVNLSQVGLSDTYARGGK